MASHLPWRRSIRGRQRHRRWTNQSAEVPRVRRPNVPGRMRKANTGIAIRLPEEIDPCRDGKMRRFGLVGYLRTLRSLLHPQGWWDPLWPCGVWGGPLPSGAQALGSCLRWRVGPSGRIIRAGSLRGTEHMIRLTAKVPPRFHGGTFADVIRSSRSQLQQCHGLTCCDTGWPCGLTSSDTCGTSISLVLKDFFINSRATNVSRAKAVTYQ
jgi:hypothetical protein